MISYVLIGILTGFTIGLMGIGAGVIMIPLLIYNGMNITQAIAIGLFLQVIPQTIPALIMHYKNNTLPIKEAIIITISSILGTYIGTYILINKIIPLRYIYFILSSLLSLVSYYIFFKFVLI